MFVFPFATLLNGFTFLEYYNKMLSSEKNLFICLIFLLHATWNVNTWNHAPFAKVASHFWLKITYYNYLESSLHDIAACMLQMIYYTKSDSYLTKMLQLHYLPKT